MKKKVTKIISLLLLAAICSALAVPCLATTNSQVVCVAAKDCKIRSGYYENKSVVFTVKKGTEMTCLEKKTNLYGNIWYKVSYNGNTGWVYSSNVNVIRKTVIVGDGCMEGTINIIPDFIWPLPGWTSISSYAGGRVSPISGRPENHRGLDIPAYYGVPVKCSANGTVEFAGWNDSYGNYVLVKHFSGYKTLYAHMSSLCVKTGQTIKQGTVLGKVGSTGRDTTGNHLHFEIRNGSSFLDPLNFVTPR